MPAQRGLKNFIFLVPLIEITKQHDNIRLSARHFFVLF